ncbi:MAG: YdcF family protein [Vicinamibacterales bacterium]
MSEFVKEWLVPGSMSFLLAGTIAGVVLLNAGNHAASVGRAWLTLLAFLYLLLSLPVVSTLLVGRGERSASRNRADSQAAHAERVIRTVTEASGAQALVVVGNGSVHYTDGARAVDYLTRRSVFCAFEAARLVNLLEPALVVTTGGVAGHPEARPEGELLRDMLLTFGVPDTSILVESRSTTTSQQVANVCALLEARDVPEPFVVVTTSAHMPRVLALFNQRGVRTVPSTTPELRYDDGRTGWRRWCPSMSALMG